MDKDLMERRINAIEIQCNVADAKVEQEWILGEGYVNLPTRRLRELVELARIGLEHA